MAKVKTKKKTVKKRKQAKTKKKLVKTTKPIKKKTVKKKPKKEKLKIILINQEFKSNKKQAIDLYNKSCFGELKEGKIYYSLPEALFLLEKKKVEVQHKSKKISFEKLLEKFLKIDKKIQTKYTVFKNLREKGYIVKTAFKFGADFRVYEKGKKPGQVHAKWMLFPVREYDPLVWHEFSAKSRVAHSTRKNLLIAIVDEENDITYYEISWTKP